MNSSDDGARSNPPKHRAAQDLAKIKDILRVKNVQRFEKLMASKATWITRTLEEIDTDWAGSFYPYYAGDYRRNFPQETIRERLENALKCSETYSEKGPNYVCRQPLICPVCASDNAHAFSQQKVRLLRAKIRQGNNTLRLLEIVVHLEHCPPDELPSALDGLSEARHQIRRVFREYQDRKFAESKREGYHRGLMALDMFIHVAPSSRSHEEVFPHLHVVAIPYSNDYSTHQFFEFVATGARLLGAETMNVTEKRYGIEKRTNVGGLADFQKHMHYLARLTKNQQIYHAIKTHAVCSTPPNFKQRTSMAEENRPALPPRFKTDAGNTQTLILFDRQIGRFELL